MKRQFLALLATIFPSFAPEPRVLTGTASYYAKSYTGKLMANGQPYNPAALTLACNDLPLGTTVYITYVSASDRERHAHATVTDRMRPNGRHRFDFSWALFRLLENPRPGFIKVTVQELTPKS